MKNQTNYSKLIAGTMTWGKWGKQFSTAQMTKLIEHCLEIGLSTFDHADIYGGYTTEAHFGDALAASAVHRENIQLISKCGIQLNAELRPNKVKFYDYSKAYIIRSVEQSLSNLKTDYLDLLLLHRPSPLLEPKVVAEAIAELKSQGKVRDFGVSNFTPSQIAMLEKEIPVVANQVEFSLTSNDAMFNGIFDDCILKDRKVMAWSPLGNVFREKTESVERIRKALVKMAIKYETTEDVLLLAWIMKHPANISPVLGTATSSRLTNAMHAQNITLEKTDWFILLEASKGHEVP